MQISDIRLDGFTEARSLLAFGANRDRSGIPAGWAVLRGDGTSILGLAHSITDARLSAILAGLEGVGSNDRLRVLGAPATVDLLMAPNSARVADAQAQRAGEQVTFALGRLVNEAVDRPSEIVAVDGAHEHPLFVAAGRLALLMTWMAEESPRITDMSVIKPLIKGLVGMPPSLEVPTLRRMFLEALGLPEGRQECPARVAKVVEQFKAAGWHVVATTRGTPPDYWDLVAKKGREKFKASFARSSRWKPTSAFVSGTVLRYSRELVDEVTSR